MYSDLLKEYIIKNILVSGGARKEQPDPYKKRGIGGCWAFHGLERT